MSTTNDPVNAAEPSEATVPPPVPCAPREAAAHAPRASSARRIASSRANGAKSRGPATAQGKARSSRNALKHGLLSNVLVLEQEDAQTFDAFTASLHEQFRPSTPLAAMLVDDLAAAHWRRIRLRRLETETLNIAIEAQLPNAIDVQHAAALAFRELCDHSPTLRLINRYETHFDCQIARTLRLLRQWNEPDSENPQTNPVPTPDTALEDAMAQPSSLPGPSAPPPSLVAGQSFPWTPSPKPFKMFMHPTNRSFSRPMPASPPHLAQKEAQREALHFTCAAAAAYVPRERSEAHVPRSTPAPRSGAQPMPAHPAPYLTSIPLHQ